MVGQDESLRSEMFWEGADKSRVLGVFYINWYHNAYELPTNREQAKERIEGILRTTSAFAATPYLLGMNGCDHQPVQIDLPEAVETAAEFSGGVKLLISNFSDYFEKIRPYSDSLQTVYGELIGRNTRGWDRLVNTASSRIPLKILNHKVQSGLERCAEPFSLISSLCGGVYQQDFLDYAWKKLMQNHPHDSICCCSIDAVAGEMETRFHKSLQTIGCIIDEAFSNLTDRIDTSGLSEQNIVVFNKEPVPVSGLVSGTVDFVETEEEEPRRFRLFDGEGRPVEAAFEHLGRTFTYTLPKDSFRKLRYVDRYRVVFLAEQVPALGYACYAVRPGEKVPSQPPDNTAVLENEYIRAVVEPNGTLTVIDKGSGAVYRNFHYFEDTGDSGNLYNYKQVGEARTTLDSRPKIEVVQVSPFHKTIEIAYSIYSPARLNNGKESQERVESRIRTRVTLVKGIARLEFRTVIENRACDHRLRACFDTGFSSEKVYADGQFDVVERDIIPWKGWQNPCLTERMQAFFELMDEGKGVVVASRGLHEYEVLAEKRTMALTLLRAVGEVGDWGVFPTPKAELLEEITTEYAVVFHQGENRAKAYQLAREFVHSSLVVRNTNRHSGALSWKHSFFALTGDYLQLSALKRREDGEGGILRFYNPSFQEQTAVITVPNVYKRVYLCNLAEREETQLEICDGRIMLKVPPKKILTLSLKEAMA